MTSFELAIVIAWLLAIGAAFLIRRHRLHLAKTALTFADRRIWVLHPRRALRLEKGLLRVVYSPAGTTIAADPRVTARLALFREVRETVEALRHNIRHDRLQHRTLVRLNLTPQNT